MPALPSLFNELVHSWNNVSVNQISQSDPSLRNNDIGRGTNHLLTSVRGWKTFQLMF